MAVSLRGSEERMKRTVLLTAALVFLLTVPISAASLFSDVRQTDWFASYVETARDLGIVSGYPDGSFKPSRRVSYGEFLAMAMRGQGTSNTDVTPYKAHWARPFYDAAAAQEIFSEAQVVFARPGRTHSPKGYGAHHGRTARQGGPGRQKC